MRVYDRALTEKDIMNLYNREANPYGFFSNRVSISEGLPAGSIVAQIVPLDGVLQGSSFWFLYDNEELQGEDDLIFRPAEGIFDHFEIDENGYIRTLYELAIPFGWRAIPWEHWGGSCSRGPIWLSTQATHCDRSQEIAKVVGEHPNGLEVSDPTITVGYFMKPSIGYMLNQILEVGFGCGWSTMDGYGQRGSLVTLVMET